MRNMNCFAAIVSVLFISACGRPAGTDQPDPEYVTRGQMLTDLVGDIAVIFEINDDEPCTAGYTDVPDNTPLCRTVNLLDSLGFELSYPDGLWHPEDPVNNAQMWKLTTLILGFGHFSANDCAPDIMQGMWYSPYAGTLCQRGLIHLDEEGNANPGQTVSLEAWETQKSILRTWRDQETTRFDAAEKLVTLVLQEDYIQYPCTSTYSDVPADSLTCYLTNVLLDEGLLDSSNSEFRPDDFIIWDELLKLEFDAVGEPASSCENGRCCTVSSENWACGYFEDLCQRGLLDGYIVQGERIMRGGLLRTTLLFKASLVY